MIQRIHDKVSIYFRRNTETTERYTRNHSKELPAKKSFKLRITNKLLSVLEDEDSFIEVCKIISKSK